MMPGVPDLWRHEVDRRMALAREWDELVDKVRKLPGFADFLRPPPFEALLPAASAGPVIIVNISQWRCDALVVKTDGVEPIPLPNLTQQSVAAQANAYLTAVQIFQAETEAFHAATQLWEASDRGPVALLAWAEATTAYAKARKELEDQLGHTLRWMWDEFAAKILDHLGYRSTPDDAQTWPRVWWCPTGALTLLPLHAAGYHDSGDDSVLDRVVSSYTPTLRALLQSREAQRQANPATDRMLFVGVGYTPGHATLKNVERERRQLSDLLPGERWTVLLDQDSTKDNVLQHLASHPWVHFSCHGTQDLSDPSHGGLILYDNDRLTIADISTGEYQGEFAFLAACKTMTGGVDLPDEAITLAAAMHYTGYRHVIATLWSVGDEYAAQVTEGVYKTLIHNGQLDASGAAWALHTAVRQLRETHRAKPSVWTSFTYTGP
jgi:CHAT domain-containing protein